jgi:FkbM family methyltransferase
MIQRVVKAVLKSAGLKVSRISLLPPPLLYHKIGLLLDVGANVGQFASEARYQGYSGRIVSFEPLSKAHRELNAKASKDQAWIIHERCALGSAPGEAEINVSRNFQSSSLRSMLAACQKAAPDAVYFAKERIQVITLDSIFKTYRRDGENVYLKIDTQGYEKEVLDGAKESIKHIKAIQLELSVVPLYESQSLYEYFFQFLREQGFELWALMPDFFSDPKTGRLLQFDGIFTRP